jgi:hypothetical protein
MTSPALLLQALHSRLGVYSMSPSRISSVAFFMNAGARYLKQFLSRKSDLLQNLQSCAT